MHRKTFSKPTYSLPYIMEQFLHFKKAQGMSKRTLMDYETTFSRFAKYFEEDNINIPILKHKLVEFFSSLSNKAPATYNIPYSNLHALFNWAVDQRYIKENPIKSLGLKKHKDEGRTRHVDEDVIFQLLKVIDISTYPGLRDYAIVLLELDTGIRPQEAFSLRNSDIDYRHFSLTIRREIAKTRSSRILPLSSQTLEIMRRLISVKPPEWDDYLFNTSEGYQMTVSHWNHRLSKYGKKINCKLSSYVLRHTFAIMFIRNGGNLFALQHEMGHRDLTMTKRYVQLAQSDIQKQHSLASPINKFIKRTTRIQKLFKNQ